MKKKILFLVAIICSLFSLHASNTVVVPGATVPQGGSGVISVELNNDKEYTAFSMKLTLPDGVSLVSVSKGSRMAESHSLTGNAVTGMITCLSSANDVFTGTSGELFTITVSADDELTIGTLLAATLTEVNFSTTSGEESLANADFDITICEDRVLLDENSTTPPEDAVGVNVKVKRGIKGGDWNTICLPFAMTEEQCKAAFGDDVQLADFYHCEATYDGDDVTGLNVEFQDVDITGGMEANHPYIIKVSEAITEFTADGVDIVVEEEPSVDCDEYRTGSGTKKDPYVYHYNSLVGVYEAQTDIPDLCLFLSGNKFWYSSGFTKIKAFRAYFDFYDVLTEVEEAGARIAISIDDDPTGIISVNKSKKESNVYYDLMGRRTEKPRKGNVYIVDGKKVYF